jgi:outer membrane lipoprotein carrier protein
MRAGRRSEGRGAGRVPVLSMLAAAMLLLVASRAMAGRDDPSGGAVEEARRVEAALQGVRGLVAAFTQTVESPGLPSPQVETGTLYLLRPGRMRWEYSRPAGKLAIADGDRTWLYLPEDRQVLVAPLTGADGDRGMSILLRERIDLLQQFAITWAPPGEKGAVRALQLIPRSPRDEYRSLLLTPGPDHLVRALTIVDALGGRVTYRFEEVRPVASLEAGLFRFTPPPGIEVQELRRR